MKKTILPFVAIATILTGCMGASNASITYKATTTLTNQERIQEMPQAINRLLENRLIALGEMPLEIEVEPESNGFEAEVTLSGSNIEVLSILTEKITAPTTLRFMVEAPLEEADIILAEKEGFKETLLTEDHIDWLTAKAHPVTRKGEVVLNFTEEGKTLKTQIFEENKGKHVGIFVRERPVYKLKIEDEDISEDILVLRNIPNPEIAQIFADDINIGLHITFTPVQ